MTTNIETLRAELAGLERDAEALRAEIHAITPREWFGNYVGLTLTLAEARRGYHIGDCNDDVAALAAEPHIAAQLDALDAADLVRELREYGCWDADELSDHRANQRRLLWIVSGDTAEIFDRPDWINS